MESPSSLLLPLICICTGKDRTIRVAVKLANNVFSLLLLLSLFLLICIRCTGMDW